MVDPDVLRAYVAGLGVSWRENSVSYIFECPRCGRDKLFVSKRSGRFVCWKCKETSGFQGKPEYAFAELLGLPVASVCRALYGGAPSRTELRIEAKLSDFYGFDEEPDEVASVLVPEVSWPFDYYEISDPRSARGAAYLEGRGVPAEVAGRYGVRYAPTERSVVFPVGSGGRLYGWQRRLVVPHKWTGPDGVEVEVPKSPTMPGMKREKLLMFADRVAGSEHAVLCEGPIDAIKADLCGGNVATMGKAASSAQLGLLRAAGVRKLYLALDPDAADEVERVARSFSDLELFEMRAPEGAGDLGAMSFGEVRELFDAAPRVLPGRVFVYVEDRYARGAES